ncbi:hypothetical protein HDU67_006795 [Dinochytrium kinnereticum]|nr:hypothetical protein HDU67_006795 [Dinochytrium kinnereticum]
MVSERGDIDDGEEERGDLRDGAVGSRKVVPMSVDANVERCSTSVLQNEDRPQPFWCQPQYELPLTLANIFLQRLVVLAPLVALVVITHSEAWATNTTGSVLVFQTMIAILGFSISLLLGECSWMVQGAVAAAWTWRSRGRRGGSWWERRRKKKDPSGRLLPLIVGESIQTGRPAIILGKGGSFQDLAMSLVVPMAVCVVAAMYKFGVGIGVNKSVINSAIMTIFLSRGLDKIPALVKGCNMSDNICNWNYLQQRYGLVPTSMDPVDYTWASGVEFGQNITNTSYHLIAGDVPAIDENTRRLVLGGINFMQHMINITVNCAGNAGSGWTSGCNDTPNATASISYFSGCYRGRGFSGVLTFFPYSLNLSCTFNMTSYFRDVNADPFGSKWRVRHRNIGIPGGFEPLSEETWVNVTEPWKKAVARDVEKSIDETGIGLCLYGCSRLNQTFKYSVAARLSVTMAEHLFYTSHVSSVVEQPLPGTVLSSRDNWVEMYTPGGRIQVAAMGSKLSMFGSYAELNVQQNDYVVVSFWILTFAVLPLVEIIAAMIKWRYACHPMDPICGVLWTISNLQKNEVTEDGSGNSQKLVAVHALGPRPTLVPSSLQQKTGIIADMSIMRHPTFSRA